MVTFRLFKKKAELGSAAQMVDGRWTVNPVQGNTVGSNPTTPTTNLKYDGA